MQHILSFEGSDGYVALHNYHYTAPVAAVTVEATIKTDHYGQECVVASFDRSEFWRLEVGGNIAPAGHLCMSFMSEGTIHDSLYTQNPIADGLEHHVAFVFAGDGFAHLYIDGELDKSIATGATLGENITRYGFLGVGSEATDYNDSPGPDDPENHFVGTIKEFRVWEIARSQAELVADRDANLTGNETGLALCFQCDEGSGDTITDIVAGDTGTIFNNVFWVPDGAYFYHVANVAVLFDGLGSYVEANNINLANFDQYTVLMTFYLYDFNSEYILVSESGGFRVGVDVTRNVFFEVDGFRVEVIVELPRAAWVDFAVTVDTVTSEVTGYINGFSYAQVTGVSKTASSSPLRIGADVVDGSGPFYRGAIKRIGFFSRALTASEVVGYGADGWASNASGLVLSYTPEAESDVLIDDAGKNDGAFYGGVKWASLTNGPQRKRFEAFPLKPHEPYTLSPHRLAGQTLVDGEPVGRRVLVTNRRTGDYVMSTVTDPDYQGCFEFVRLPPQTLADPYIVTCLDDRIEEYGNALIYDRVYQVDDDGHPPQA